jgi:hypothetical protein
MKFIGGVLDGREFEVEEGFPTLRVPIKNGKWHSYPDQVVRDYQIYVKSGDVYRYQQKGD